MIIPVILEKSLKEIRNKIKIVDGFAAQIQIDLCDNQLFNGLTYLDANEISKIKCKPKIELHLMVVNPLDYLTAKIPNVIKICSQIEAKVDHNKFISLAKSYDYKIGLSVGPDTDCVLLEPYLDELDFVQFMDIVPGGQGHTQIPYVLSKIKNFHEQHPKIRIQVDGGIKTNNILNLAEIGVKDFVVGSEIFKSSNPYKKYVELENMTKVYQDSISTLSDKKIQKVAILGGAAWAESDAPYKDAFKVSKILAQAGYELVNGGGPGVMKACTDGAHAGKGRVISITYHPNKPKRHYEGVDPANNFDDEIITLDYFDRTKVMLQTTQAHIVFRGSLGTLSEFGMTWVSSWIHEPNNKPIVLYGAFWKDFLEVIDKHMDVTKDEKSIVTVCTTPQQVLDFLKGFED